MEEHNIIDQPIGNNKKKKRPIAITLICVLGFIGALFVFPSVFSQKASQIGSWFPPYLGLSGVIGFICMVGLWKMKKWAAYIYTIFVALNQVILLIMGVWNIMALLMPIIVIGISIYHINKMD